MDTFTYTVSDAVHLYRTQLPPIATIGGVKITGGVYGSAFTPLPGSHDEFYGLTDRGPNVDAADGSKVEPLPAFDPAIGRFKLEGTRAKLEKTIPLRAACATGGGGRSFYADPVPAGRLRVVRNRRVHVYDDDQWRPGTRHDWRRRRNREWEAAVQLTGWPSPAWVPAAQVRPSSEHKDSTLGRCPVAVPL